MPVTGRSGPHIAVRLGSILLLLSDQEALQSTVEAVKQAELLADGTFGAHLR